MDRAALPEQWYREMSSGRIRIQVLPGNLEAHARVIAGPAADRKALNEALAAERVVFGINEEACNRLAASLQDPDFAIDEVAVARGIRPVPGRDGSLDLSFNSELLAGRVREDGSLDFRDRGRLVPVEPGDVVAVYRKPVEVQPGRNVRGKELVPDRPADPWPGLGEGTELSEEGEVRATVAGIVSYEKDLPLSVTSCFEHKGDVDLRSGDLHMEGALMIKGDVAANASANATGDLVVNGMVDGGIVRANGSVTIAGGVVGSETGFVVAGGDLACKYAEGADLRSGGTISIESNAIKSRITGRKVEIKKDGGSIIGGEVRAAESIVLGNVGSKLSTRTLISIGPIQDFRSPIENAARPEDTPSGIRIVGVEEDLLASAVIQISGEAHPGVVIQLGSYELRVQELVRAVRFLHDPNDESGIKMEKLGR